MAGLFDWARYVTGQTDDPEQALGQWSDEQQARNRAAISLDANGNPLPTPVALPAASPAAGPNGAATNGNPDVQGAAQAQAASTLPANQEPNATKTPVSLGHLMMNLQQYNEREQGFNQALGMGFAAFAQPRDRQMVSGMFNVKPADPIATANAQQALASNLQGQDRMNMVTAVANDPQKLAQMAGALHMDPTLLQQLIRTDPQKAAGLIQSAATPTDALKNLGQLDYYGNQIQNVPGATADDVEAIKAGIKSGIAGDRMAPMIQAQVAWRQAHPGQPPPWNPNNITSYEQYVANEKSKESDRGDAAKVLGGQPEHRRGAPRQPRATPRYAWPEEHPSRSGQARGRHESVEPASRSAELGGAERPHRRGSGGGRDLAQDRRRFNRNRHAHMAGTGTRVTQQEVGPLKDSISSVMNLNQDYDTYTHNAINPFVTKIKKTVANAYGASGNLAHMDPEYEPWLHPIYRKGGELYKEGGGADKLPDLQELTPGKLSWLKGEVANYPAGRDDALDSLQQEGFDVSKYRKTDPDKW